MVKLNRPHIGIFGKMNVGKSSLINALTGQQVSVVADHPGTTTDPVKKIIEILGVGPVTVLDTPGIDDTSALGTQRVERTNEALDQVDLAILVFADQFDSYDQTLMETCVARKVPFFFVHNKSDLQKLNVEIKGADVVDFSCKSPALLPRLLEMIKKHLPKSSYSQDVILDDFVKAGEEVVLVIPIDASAPEGRLILPQVQTIRNLLDIGAVAVCLKDTELRKYLQTHTPKLVVTDSQAFGYVKTVVPPTIALTSFSILFSRLKGDFDAFLRGTHAIDRLQDGDRVLILESCSHSVNKCDDIGRVKIPNLLRKYTGKKLEFDVVANLDPIPADAEKYKLAVQCGGCMVTRTQIMRRLEILKEKKVPLSNYGLTIAYCNGIFERVTEIFRKKGI
ncbi:[FeFe] hydrogenase H-cluster maturation GTPase HydF [Candidatus Avelusimicrobium gallicola]|uniref:[FeFe] hydrogenase H-cluster maturation GTPase HydF n=1 Tax=Candidatus Avelusimicrobium gallicola TaxID=2562704 RepID=A0A1Y4DME8_9BACT|nr:[FeFe] hydrogenase H-cluster maturation GTPase HydF [Elusimicrobium sp. An273]OUO56571.1 [FeFe] hydrogenase H-cluster maturation GTPase HydF [Elusimicrobium sp. An273]